jgi:hypothetical protein
MSLDTDTVRAWRAERGASLAARGRRGFALWQSFHFWTYGSGPRGYTPTEAAFYRLLSSLGD